MLVTNRWKKRIKQDKEGSVCAGQFRSPCVHREPLKDRYSHPIHEDLVSKKGECGPSKAATASPQDNSLKVSLHHLRDLIG